MRSISREVGSTLVKGKLEWLRRLEQGNAFNKLREKAYPYKEPYVEKPGGVGYYRVDSYNPTGGEIVSRKFTQLSDISDKTIKYVDELGAKYPDGRR